MAPTTKKDNEMAPSTAEKPAQPAVHHAAEGSSRSEEVDEASRSEEVDEAGCRVLRELQANTNEMLKFELEQAMKQARARRR